MARKSRPYRSLVRKRQAGDTRQRILKSARRLLEAKGYAGMTVDAVAREAGVAVQTVYAAFGSKTGLLAELIDQASFGPDYEELVRQARETREPRARLRFAARIARQIHEERSSTLDLAQGAGVVAPALARLEQTRGRNRYEAQKGMIDYLAEARALRADLEPAAARDILWALTGQDLYRLLVRGRGWTPERYEDWLGDTLVDCLCGLSSGETRSSAAASSPPRAPAPRPDRAAEPPSSASRTPPRPRKA